MKTVAYIRVSTDKQAEAGVSLDAQRAKVEAYATLYDLEIVEIVVGAGESAKTLDREGLRVALGHLDAGKAEGLLVVKLDRLTRSVKDLGELMDGYFAPGRFALMSVSENLDTRSAAGRLVINILASVSQWEREAIGERTSAAMQHLRKNGKYTGGAVRYGYRVADDGETLERDSFEQQVIFRALELREEGLSLSATARKLDDEGYKTRNGGRFQAAQIKKMEA
jgi:DNA invertase Pin-like site-specific DNA recombinase